MKKIFSFTMMLIMAMLIRLPLFAGQSLTGWLYDLPDRKLWVSDLSPYQSYIGEHSTYPGCIEIATTTIAADYKYLSFENVPAKSSCSVYCVQLDTATAVSNKFYVLPANLIAQPNFPRCLAISFSSNTADARKFYGSTILQILTARGKVTTETIISSNAAIAAASYTSNAVAYIYGATTTITQGASAQVIDFNIGTGDKLGVPTDMNLSSDLKFIKESYVDKELTTYTVNTQYDTLTPTNVPNGAIDYFWGIVCNLEKTRY